MKRIIRSAERTVVLGYILSLVGILALAFAAYEIPRQLVQTARQSAHSHRVVAKIEEIARGVLDAESTGRAYVITGNPDLLARYYRVLPEVDRDVQAFGELTRNDPGHAAYITRLQSQIAGRFKVMNEALEGRQQHGFEYARRISLTGQGRAGMNRILSTLDSMTAAEEHALLLREVEEKRITNMLTVLIGAIVIVGALVMTWVTLQSRKLIQLQKASEEQAKHLAFHDTLTGLPNLRLLNDRLLQAIGAGARHGETFAVLFLDLDGFKAVNDTFGHDVGDELLKEVADRLKRLVRAEDTVARLGGDEFVVAIRHIKSAGDAAHVAGKIIASIASPYALDGHPIRISTSVGISMYTSGDSTAEDLIKAADDALYSAKRAGKNRYEFAAAGVEAVPSTRLQGTRA